MVTNKDATARLGSTDRFADMSSPPVHWPTRAREVSPYVSYAFDRFRFMLTDPLHIEDARPSYALAYEADEAISRVFGSSEHDDAVAALEEVLRVKESGADSLELLQTLARTSAIAKWAALCEKLNETAAMVSQGLPEGGRGDGSRYASHLGPDSCFHLRRRIAVQIPT